MLAYLKGSIINVDDHIVLVENAGLGYDIQVSDSVLADNLVVGGEIEIYIHHHITEAGQGLYGFNSLLERKLFRVLISMSGIGPKLGMTIIGAYSVEKLVEIIRQNNVAMLTQISGIGKKTAEKIIVELQDKIIKNFGSISNTVSGQPNSVTTGLSFRNSLANAIQDEAVAAIKSLGYNQREAAEIMHKLQREQDISKLTVQEIIKLGFKYI